MDANSKHEGRPSEYRGPLTPGQVAEGMNAAMRNALPGGDPISRLSHRSSPVRACHCEDPYCQAVAQFGLHSCSGSALPDLILGRNPNVPHFVGCRLEDPPLPADRSIAHVIRVVTEWMSGKLIVIVTVRLFANSGVEKHGPPVYEVVVGELPMSSESSGEHIQRDRVTSRRSAR